MHAVDRTPLDQIASLPVALAATELPALVSDLCRAAAGGNLPGSLERADWLDRLDELRGARPGESGPIARDLGVLQRGMLTALREHSAEFPGNDLMAAAADLA
ncbi:MAG: hypothetical protein QOJ07_286, partial [Thermoleophilaceae bacterium]|nr:hypothetical protein [Thermoleophilaceae bacterium]